MEDNRVMIGNRSSSFNSYQGIRDFNVEGVGILKRVESADADGADAGANEVFTLFGVLGMPFHRERNKGFFLRDKRNLDHGLIR